MKLWQRLVGQGYSGATPYRYWRIYITAVNSASPALYEVEFRGSVGGADLTSPSTTAQGDANTDGGYPAVNAIDNNGSTFWYTYSMTNAWLAVDLVTAHVCAEVAITAYGFSNSPKDFVIQGSNTSLTTGFVDVATFTGQTSWVGGTQRTFALPTGEPSAGGSAFLTLSNFSSGTFVNPTYAQTSNNQYATRTQANGGASTITFDAAITGVIPIGMALLGIKVYVEGKCTSAPIDITSFEMTFPTFQLGVTESILSVGGPTDKLGITSLSSIASNTFRFANYSGASSDISVDDIRIEVFWGL